MHMVLRCGISVSEDACGIAALEHFGQEGGYEQ